ncbi:MAG: hypothetical protein K0Q73_6338, partial [Paenibacillus sp.]|nr:hypothetical protein [Paenibacillus sp.]
MRIFFKKRLSIILVMLMVLSGMNGLFIGDDKAYANGVTFAGGTGSLELPYLIATPDQLNEVRNHLEAGIYFKLTADIDLSEYPADDDAGWLPIGYYVSSTDYEFFSGNFDGNGFKIMNLMINRPAQDYIGLFETNKGTIANVTLENINVTGNYAVGGLAGENIGTINNTTVTGSVYGLGTSIGGLVAYNTSEISNSSSAASVHGIETQVGGLAGANLTVDAERPATISNSFATGDVKGEGGYVGGLVGISKGVSPAQNGYGSIKNSYATGNVSGGHRMGGLVGDNSHPIYNSYATGTVTGNVYGDDHEGHE